MTDFFFQFLSCYSGHPRNTRREGYEDEIDGKCCYDLEDNHREREIKFGYKAINKNNAQGIGGPEFRTISQICDKNPERNEEAINFSVKSNLES